ncbi:MAG TPA: helix-turn-helix domain-containing protein, partial [Candidatus Angelobacter sp.]
NSPLSALVKCFWYWEGAPTTHNKERLMPTGEPTIVFNLLDGPIRMYDADDVSRSTSYGHAVLSGARASCFVIDTIQQERVFGIQFQPGGVFPFSRVPASETENQTVELEHLWRGAARELRERLLAAPTINGMFLLAEEYLFALRVKPLELHPAVSFARQQFCSLPHKISVASVQDKIGLSQRRFIQLFHEQVGLTPKAFCRVRRFQRILETVHGQREVDWIDVALDCGYYDQAHFIHDFHEFSGLTPTQYLTRATEHLNHVPVL